MSDLVTGAPPRISVANMSVHMSRRRRETRDAETAAQAATDAAAQAIVDAAAAAAEDAAERAVERAADVAAAQAAADATAAADRAIVLAADVAGIMERSAERTARRAADEAAAEDAEVGGAYYLHALITGDFRRASMTPEEARLAVRYTRCWRTKEGIDDYSPGVDALAIKRGEWQIMTILAGEDPLRPSEADNFGRTGMTVNVASLVAKILSVLLESSQYSERPGCLTRRSDGSARCPMQSIVRR